MVLICHNSNRNLFLNIYLLNPTYVLNHRPILFWTSILIFFGNNNQWQVCNRLLKPKFLRLLQTAGILVYFVTKACDVVTTYNLGRQGNFAQLEHQTQT